MADTRLSDLSAAGALSASDLFYVVQTPGSGGAKATGTQLLTLVGTTYLAKAGGTMTGALTIASGTLIASAPALNVTQTWNNGAVDFDAIVVDATRIASSASTFFLNLKLAGTSKFQVRYDGNVVMAAGAAIYTAGATGGAWNYNTAGESAAATRFALPINSPDVMLYRDAAATLALRNGTAQQSFIVYNTESSGLTNYERLKLTGVAGTSVNITAESLGTGSANLDVVITPKGTGKIKLYGSNCTVDSSGILLATAVNANGNTTINYSAHGVRNASTGEYAWTAGAAIASADTALFRGTAGQVDVTNGTAGTFRDLKLRNLLAGGGNGSYVQTPSMTVDRLADAATAGAGARAFVTDATATTFLSTVAGGGSNKVPVVSDGTNWLIG